MSEYNEENAEDMDPSVPTELLLLHLDLEDAGVTPDEFREAFGDEVRQ